ncbi:peptidase domain-containing ABC transporter [Chitinophaga agrisoli]|uniref:Peptidase domain-containing ABC transporter n=1 Tax=Chitinophaga agrisoli TaxID=2607653 RepID=A0A5B2VQ19_9BACT|nr:peptidase domain-containing ABC transporter [Chitinophaga agrisoli]KAA2240189.1 peptidase domain-containing ABC transporter [Chitinophaga agrisoli]
MLRKFPFYKQYDEMDCGATCLRMIARHYGKDVSLDHLRKLTHTSRDGASLLALSEAAETLGFQTAGVKLSLDDLAEAAPFPCVAFWQQRHFIVVYKIKRDTIYVADPAHGLLEYSRRDFLQGWAMTDNTGIILSLEPSAGFHETEGPVSGTRNISVVFSYLSRFKGQLWQLLLGLLAGSAMQLVFPFLTQSIVDIGIRYHDLNFIYLVLFAQLMVFMGRTTVEILRGYIILHLGARLNINLLSDFFAKLMRLPLGFFDSKKIGDILQRIGDHQRIESFMTSGVLNTVFSLINLLVFSIILAVYNMQIFTVFAAGSLLYFGWVKQFMGKRAALDYKRFTQLSANQEKNLELITGMQEIKLHNAERLKRWQWQQLQVKLFRVNVKSLTLKQWQTGGAGIINEGKNIIIAFLAAKLVLQGDITLGVMLSVSYITGQLNAPIMQLVEFIQAFQDARLSLERINEIHAKADEEEQVEQKLQEAPGGDIRLNNLSFRYNQDPRAPYILQNINLVIPEKKVTAIVGASGSGKTTLLKLLLKFYEPTSGGITVGNTRLEHVRNSVWRDQCGVVMQEGFIFNDTVMNNIAVGEEAPDMQRIIHAAQIANIHELVEELPMKYRTPIGGNGMSLSTGQKQRILIARVVYKNPEVILFDEATSALDARNERVIVNNLHTVFEGRTVIVIAHRLSTVRNADKIVVLEKGAITEVGTHQQLVEERGFYFNLVRNQLELDA